LTGLVFHFDGSRRPQPGMTEASRHNYSRRQVERLLLKAGQAGHHQGALCIFGCPVASGKTNGKDLE